MSQPPTLDQLIDPSCNWADLTYFEILGFATPLPGEPLPETPALRSAFRKRLMLVHPDKHRDDPDGGELANHRMSILNDANDTLLDPSKAAIYVSACDLRRRGIHGSDGQRIVPVFRAHRAAEPTSNEDFLTEALQRLLKAKSNTPVITRIDTVHWRAAVTGTMRYLLSGIHTAAPCSGDVTWTATGQSEQLNAQADYTLYVASPIKVAGEQAFPDLATIGFKPGNGPTAREIEEAEAQNDGRVNIRGFGLAKDRIAVPKFIAKNSARKHAKADKCFFGRVTKHLAQVAIPDDFASHVIVGDGPGVPLEDFVRRSNAAGAPVGTVVADELQIDEPDLAQIFGLMKNMSRLSQQAPQEALVERFRLIHPEAPTDLSQYHFGNVVCDSEHSEAAGEPTLLVIECPAQLVVYEYGPNGQTYWMLVDDVTGAVGGYAPFSSCKVALKVAGGVVAAPFVLAGAVIGGAGLGIAHLVKGQKAKSEERKMKDLEEENMRNGYAPPPPPHPQY